MVHLPLFVSWVSFSSDSVKSLVSSATGSSLWAESVPFGFSPLCSSSLVLHMPVGVYASVSFCFSPSPRPVLVLSSVGVFFSWVPCYSSSVVLLSGFGSRCLLVFPWSSLAGCHYCASSSSALFSASASLHRCLTGVVLHGWLCLPSCCPCVHCLLGHLCLSGICILCLGLLLWCLASAHVSLSMSLGSLRAPSSVATTCPPSASALSGSCSPPS